MIERCPTPRGEIQLQQRGQEHEIISNGVFLSSSADGPSNRVLVRVALDACAHEPRRLLIGGLGVGATLAEAAAQTALERIVVVEIEDAVIRWTRTHLAPHSADAHSDPRVELVHADLVGWLPHADEVFDAVCLDIDNGPDWTVTDDNTGLYTHEGLTAVRRLVAPGGAIAVWAAHQSPAFVERFRGYVADVMEVSVPVPRGEPDRIYVGQVSPGRS